MIHIKYYLYINTSKRTKNEITNVFIKRIPVYAIAQISI